MTNRVPLLVFSWLGMRGSIRAMMCAAALAVLVPAPPAHADVPARGLPASVLREALEDPQPSAFSPADFDTTDFRVERGVGTDASFEATLEPGSLEWVRTAAWVVVPRAVLRVTVHGAEHGSVRYAGVSHRLARTSPDSHDAEALIPIALIAAEDHPVQVEAETRGSSTCASFAVRFAPRPGNQGRVLFDTRCSPYGFHVARGTIPADSWLYVGCNGIVTQRGENDSATVEALLLWDQAGDVMIDGAPAIATLDGVLYEHRVTAGPGAIELAARGSRVTLAYALPEPLRAGFLGLGVGPYYYRLKDDRITHTAGVPMLTLYAGYTLNPTMRIVYFNATVLDRVGYMDQGAYLWTEQVRFLDERLSLNLLLGANALVYVRHEQVRARLSAPQGFEIVFRDFLARNRNLTAGAFLYPAIGHRSYYNAWLRWGSGAFFGELNYIAWEEPHESGASKSQSLGISFGTPIARFLRFL